MPLFHSADWLGGGVRQAGRVVSLILLHWGATSKGTKLLRNHDSTLTRDDEVSKGMPDVSFKTRKKEDFRQGFARHADRDDFSPQLRTRNYA